MTCTYEYSHFRHFQNCCNRDGNTIFKHMNYVPIVVATDLEVHFSVLKKGVSQYFCLYSVCTSHWCLVMSFWLKVCIYSHTRGVKLGLGLGFMQTSQVLPHWLNQSFSFWTLPYTQRHCHVRIEKGPVQTVAIILEAHNFLEYHYMPNCRENMTKHDWNGMQSNTALYFISESVFSAHFVEHLTIIFMWKFRVLVL